MALDLKYDGGVTLTLLAGSGTLSLRALPATALSLMSSLPEDLGAGEVLPPVFSAISVERGETLLITRCTTDREALVRMRARKMIGTLFSGDWIYSTVETVPNLTDHVRQITGLDAATRYHVEITINATVGPDLGYSDFHAGTTGPVFKTLDAGDGDPDYPNAPAGG